MRENAGFKFFTNRAEITIVYAVDLLQENTRFMGIYFLIQFSSCKELFLIKKQD